MPRASAAGKKSTEKRPGKITSFMRKERRGCKEVEEGVEERGEIRGKSKRGRNERVALSVGPPCRF